MIQTLIASITLFALSSAQESTADRMLIQATADQPIVTTGIVDAPIKEVWKAWTTNEGILSWMVASGEVDFRIGGSYRTSYLKNSNLSGPDTIENTILAYDPMRMIAIKTSKAPEQFPFKTAIAKTWTIIYFKETDSTHTEVTIRMNGFDATEESAKMKAFFVMGNQASLNALVAKFSAKKVGSN